MVALKKKLLIVFSVVLALALFFDAPAALAGIGGSMPITVNAAQTAQMTAGEIFRRNADAVFMIETFDSDGDSIRTGSGFFISETGLAVTNLHVIANAESAVITLYSGSKYQMRGVHAVSEEFNLIIFSIDSDEKEWNHLTLADSSLIETGNSVYTIGSPLGYINTMSGGIISSTRREVDGENLIQFTAPISFGSGGSPLFNTRGEVIGIASSSFSYGQNLNLAVPVNHVKTMQPGECVPLSELILTQEPDTTDEG